MASKSSQLSAPTTHEAKITVQVEMHITWTLKNEDLFHVQHPKRAELSSKDDRHCHRDERDANFLEARRQRACNRRPILFTVVVPELSEGQIALEFKRWAGKISREEENVSQERQKRQLVHIHGALVTEAAEQESRVVIDTSKQASLLLCHVASTANTQFHKSMTNLVAVWELWVAVAEVEHIPHNLAQLDGDNHLGATNIKSVASIVDDEAVDVHTTQNGKKQRKVSDWNHLVRDILLVRVSAESDLRCGIGGSRQTCKSEDYTDWHRKNCEHNATQSPEAQAPHCTGAYLEQDKNQHAGTERHQRVDSEAVERGEDTARQGVAVLEHRNVREEAVQQRQREHGEHSEDVAELVRLQPQAAGRVVQEPVDRLEERELAVPHEVLFQCQLARDLLRSLGMICRATQVPGIRGGRKKD